MKKSLGYLLFFVFYGMLYSQETPVLSIATVKQVNKELTIDAHQNTRPRLVVGIVIDQMRFDYLSRFWDTYGEGGFKRIVNKGYNCNNHHYNYIPTYTAPGHASIFSGTTPSVHGVIGNNWYDKHQGKSIYCVSDTNYKSVGTTSDRGKMSPSNMEVSTITDQLRLYTQLKSKVIGISIKDRGAILPAGHAANAAYWYSGKNEGHWISSSYYMNALPSWVKAFNKSDAAEKYKKDWNTLYDINTYNESGSDDNRFEGTFKGEEKAVFPHRISELWKENGNFDLLRETPFGNSLTTDFAIAAIENERMGTDEITDFLTISFSSTDYIGHKYGVNSKELQDTYLRLDKDLERLLQFLDTNVGSEEYLLFLTSDHGVASVPAYLKSRKIPADYFDTNAFRTQLNNFLSLRYKQDNLIKNISNDQIFLDKEQLKTAGIPMSEIEQTIVDEIIDYKHIAAAYTASSMKTRDFTKGMANLLQNGYHHKRSGDVLYVLQPNIIGKRATGTTHGSGFVYDTHVPLVFYGKGIQNGKTSQRTHIEDIAPTLALLISIGMPEGSTGNPIYQLLDDL